MSTKPVDADERARVAVAEFRKMLPGLNGYARALTGNQKTRVELMRKHGAPQTNGETIMYFPRIELGDRTPHKRNLCDRRDTEGQQMCRACGTRESVMSDILHEIAHCAYGTFSPALQSELQEAVTFAIGADADLLDEKLADHFRTTALRANAADRANFMKFAHRVSPFLPSIFNAVEDARINESMFKARPGTRAMFDADNSRIFMDGMTYNDGGKSVTEKWSDAPLNTQIIMGIFMEASGLKYDRYLDERIARVCSHPRISNFLRSARDADSPADSFAAAMRVFLELRAVGFFKSDDEPEIEEPKELDSEEGEDDTEPATPELSEADGDADAADNFDESDDSGGEGGSDSAGGADNGESGGDDAGTEGDTDGASTAAEAAAASGEPEQGSGAEDPADTVEIEGAGFGEMGEQAPDAGGDEQDAGDGGIEGDDRQGEGESEGGADDDPDSGQVPESSDDQPSDGDAAAGGSDEDADQRGAGDHSDSSDEQGSGDPVAEDSDREGSGVDGPVDSGSADGDSSGGGSPSSASGLPLRDEGYPDGDPSEGGADGAGSPGSGSGPSGDLDEDRGQVLPDLDMGLDDASLSDGVAPVESGGSGASPSDSGADHDAAGSDEADEASREPADAGADADASGEPLDFGDPIVIDMTEAEMGDAADAEKKLELALGHEKLEAIVGKWVEAVIEQAIAQGIFFETPSVKVNGVSEYVFGKSGSAWGSGRYSSYYTDKQLGKDSSITIPESVLGGALLKMRVVFADNQRAKEVHHLKGGKVNARVLGRRAAIGDPRLFKRRTAPGKKSYHVVIGMDISGSTMGRNIVLEKRAVAAQAELLSRMGIDFSIYAHSGGDVAGGGSGINLEVYKIKEGHEPWTNTTKKRLAAIGPDRANLDGHALEYLRKRADEATTATDKIILYYSDGSMPMENYTEELEILTREIRVCERKGYALLGVGINTDSPTKHGLPTVEVREDRDIIKVIKHLEGALTK